MGDNLEAVSIPKMLEQGLPRPSSPGIMKKPILMLKTLIADVNDARSDSIFDALCFLGKVSKIIKNVIRHN